MVPSRGDDKRKRAHSASAASSPHLFFLLPKYDVIDSTSSLAISSQPRSARAGLSVMRHPDGDKIVIAKNENGDWIYFSVRDGGDNGTVIDFIQKRTGENLGQVRKTLRAWGGSARSSVPEVDFVRDLFPITRDRAAVMILSFN